MISTLQNVRLREGDRVLVKVGASFYPAKVVGSGDPAKLRVELRNGSVVWVGRRSVEAIFEYVLVKRSEWEDFQSVAKEKNLEVEYTIEDASEGEGIEYHVHSHFDEAEDITWAIQVLDEEPTVANCRRREKEAPKPKLLKQSVCPDRRCKFFTVGKRRIQSQSRKHFDLTTLQ